MKWWRTVAGGALETLARYLAGHFTRWHVRFGGLGHTYNAVLMPVCQSHAYLWLLESVAQAATDNIVPLS